MNHLTIPIQSDVSIEPFNRLVKIAARTFYDNEVGGNAVAVVVLDALTRKQWVKEDDLAQALNLPPTLLRRTLQILSEDKLIAREHHRETVNNRLHTISYCCLDYEQFHDALRYRLFQMRLLFRNEVTVQEYRCPNCQRIYTSLDASSLASAEDGLFHCEGCDGELESADSGESAGLRDAAMLEKMETQLKPLTEQLRRVKDFPVPEFVGFQAWELNKNEETNLEPAFEFHGVEVVKGENVQSESLVKAVPVWSRRQGMNLTKEQRGDQGEEATTSYDGEMTVVEDDKEKINQDEKVRLYYAALYEQQQEELAAQKASESSAAAADERQVGMKSKREDDDGVEWEEG